ncbi:uncharacterized protein LOC100210520 isoform X3 [Hydra vulgaris]|uniref:Uncharacterized protein LOC100210520 isoform X3 n=1 Tax=Hydra vulgaris TaxID=6087 RepID=A0ABM4CQ72_HYDVU
MYALQFLWILKSDFVFNMYVYKAFLFSQLIYITSPLLINQRSDWGNVQAKSDDACVPITLNKPIQLWSNSFQKFYVSNNGGIFTTSYTTMIDINPWTSFPPYSLLVYWADASYLRQCTDILCGMYINQNPSNAVLSVINNTIKNGFFADGQRTIIVTWYKAPSYSSTSPKQLLENTFQSVITSDGTNTYFIASYDTITYPQSNDGTAKIGFYQNSNFRIVLPGSENLNFVRNNLNCQSNVNLLGVYVAGLTSLSGYQGINDAGVSKITSSCSFCRGDSLVQCFQPNTLQVSPSFTYTNIASSGVAATRLAWSLLTLSSSTPFVSASSIVTTRSISSLSTAIGSAINSSTYNISTAVTFTQTEPVSGPITQSDVMITSSTSSAFVSAFPIGTSFSTLPISASTAIPSVATAAVSTQSGLSSIPSSTIVATTPISSTSSGGCLFNNGGCSDICNLLNNNVVCSCSKGVLASDSRTCYDNTEFIFASLKNVVLKWNSSNTLAPIYNFGVTSTDVGIVAMDYDYKNKLFYYSRNTDTVSIISMMNIDGSNKQALFIVNSVVDGMAYDWTRNFLYYADKHNGIFSLDLNSKVLIPALVSKGISNLSSVVSPRAMVLENCGRSLFVTFWGEIGYVGRFFFNNTIKVIAGDLLYPNSLAIDRKKSRLYWADSFFSRIESSNFDGSCRQIIAFVPGYYPFSMFYWNSSLFWINWVSLDEQNSIMTTNIWNKQTVVFKNIISRGYALDLFQDDSNGLCDSTPACEKIPFVPLYPTSNQPLLPFGEGFDRKLPPSDDGGVEFRLSQDIPLFLNYPSRNVFIYTNGIISLNGFFNESTAYSVSNVPLLAVYAADFNTSQIGNVYYRESVDPTDLMMITNILKNNSLDYNSSLFNASHLVVATWDMVPSYLNPNLMSTFQAVIASDDKQSIVINLYQRLDIKGGQVGFSNGLSCNFFPPIENTELLNLGYMVFNLSKCFDLYINLSTTQIPITSTTSSPVQPNTLQVSPSFTYTNIASSGVIATRLAWSLLTLSSSTPFVSASSIVTTRSISSLSTAIGSAINSSTSNISTAVTFTQTEPVSGPITQSDVMITSSTSSAFVSAFPIGTSFSTLPISASTAITSVATAAVSTQSGLSSIPSSTIVATTPISSTSSGGCLFNNGGCSDICNLLNNNVVCSCSKGVLTSDSRTCYDNTEFIFASLKNVVLRWNSSNTLEPIYDFGVTSTDVGIVAMDYDYKNKLFYYSRNTATVSIINMMNIDGSNKQALFIVNSVVDGMAYDWTRNFLYYADKNNGIFSLDLNSKVLIPALVSKGISYLSSTVSPRAMVLENCGRSLFVTFWGKRNGYVGRFFFNNTIKVIAGDLLYPNSLAIDRKKSRLYWADSFFSRIESSNFDGSCRQIIAFVPGYYPFSMFYWNSSLFWINWVSLESAEQNSIMTTNIWNKQTVVFKNISSRGYALDLFQDDSNGLCDNTPACEKIPFVPLYPTSNQPLLPFGEGFDRKLPPSDDGGVEFRLSQDIPLFLNYPSRNVFIYTNGIISLNGFFNESTAYSVSNVPLLAVYAADFNTSQIGNVYYRESVDPTDLMMISNILKNNSLDYNSSLFNASHLVVATWDMVPSYYNPNLMSTFQAVIASDDKQSIVINLYQRLDIKGGQVGFSNGLSCNFFPPIENTELLNLGYMVFNLSECFDLYINLSTTQLPITRTTSSPGTGQISINVIPGIQNLFQETSLLMMFPETSNDISISDDSLVIFSQTVSNVYPSNSFLKYSSSVATFIGSLDESIDTYLLLMSVSYVSSSLQGQLQIGKFQTLPYTDLNCVYTLFPTIMESSPVIKLNGYTPAIDQYFSDFPLLWLYNTTVNGFGACYKEQFAFSELKNIWINYVAISRPILNISEANTYIFSTKLNRAAVNQEGRFCEQINFTYSYFGMPIVLLTPEVIISDLNTVSNESMLKIGNLITWVHSVGNTSVIVCSRNGHENQTHRPFPVKLHYSVIGTVNHCTNFVCADELECHLDKNLKPYCGCKTECPESSDVCGFNLVTYSSLCDMQKNFCNEFGNNSNTWPGMAYKGSCQQFPYLTGMVKLDPVPGAPGAFCKNVALVPNFFYKLYPLQVILTVSWESDIKRKTIHDASTVWSENVTVNSFRACVLVAGRHFFDNLPSPNVYWGVLQKRLFTSDLIEGGIINLPTWETGSQCVSLLFPRTPNLLASVSLNSSSFTDALNIWIEKDPNSLMHKICVQELQNFDGVHEGVQIHYLAVYTAFKYFPEVGDIVLTSSNIVGSTICSAMKYNTHYPKLPNPTVFVTVAFTSSFFSANDTLKDSLNNLATWIETKNNTSIQFCVDSVDWEYMKLNKLILYYVISPKFCEDGYYYFQDRCFKLLINNYTYDEAQLQCSYLNASLPTFDSASWDYFLVSLANSAIWLDFKKIDGQWEWDNSLLSYTNWGVGKPSGNGDCSISNGTQGWADVLCLQTFNVVCYKDAQTAIFDCSMTCQNGLCQVNSLGIVTCDCLPGFSGTWCDQKFPDSCQNYVTLNQPWRRYNSSSLPNTPLNISCDNMLAGNDSLWIRFSSENGGKLWDSKCIESQNYCGVKYPGWLSVSHPSVRDGLVTSTLHFYSYYCASDVGLVKIINCNNYYVYNFVKIPYWSCDFGVCTV